MLEIIQGLLDMGFSPMLALVGGLVFVYLRTSRALKESRAALKSCKLAKEGCNDEVHYLQNQISSLKSAVFVAEGRIVALEELVEDYRRGDTTL